MIRFRSRQAEVPLPGHEPSVPDQPLQGIDYFSFPAALSLSNTMLYPSLPSLRERFTRLMVAVLAPVSVTMLLYTLCSSSSFAT